MARTSASKIVKNLPSTETGSGVLCYTRPDKTGDKYVISQNPLKMQFTLWKCVEDGYEKIATSNNPLDFDEIIPYER